MATRKKLSRFPLAMAFSLISLLASAFFLGGVQANCKDEYYCHPFHSFLANKGMLRRSRKLMEVDVMLDYEKPGPNPKHEGGRGGKPVGGGLD